jgi:hypothetical protein
VGTVKSNVSSTGDFNFRATSTGGGQYLIYPDDATTANPTWLHQTNSSEDQAFVIGGVERVRIDSSGNVLPGANGTQDLGSTSLRWANIYTSDLHLNNGIGNYTIVEGEEDLFLYNNKNGKTYKFVLAEVDPSEAPKKMEK